MMQHIRIETGRTDRHMVTEVWRRNAYTGALIGWGHVIRERTWMDDLTHGMRSAGIGWPREPGVHCGTATGGG